MALHCYQWNPFYATINSTILTSPGQPTGIWPSFVSGGSGEFKPCLAGVGNLNRKCQDNTAGWSKAVQNCLQACLVHSTSWRLMFPASTPLLKCQWTRKGCTDTSLLIRYERNLLLKQLNCYYMNHYFWPNYPWITSFIYLLCFKAP